MKLSDIGELSLIDKIRSRFGGRSRSVLKGIGDDAAVLRPDGRKLLATTDMMVEGVHFDLRLVLPYQVGFKLVSVNVSDIYAMRGSPAFLLLGFAAPPDTDESFLDGLLDGIADALGLYGVALAGGDVSSSKVGISLSATLLGYSGMPVTRTGARPGDRLYVTGPLGDSTAGLGLLKAIGRPVDLNIPLNRPLKWEIMRPLLARHLMPEARRAPGNATALIDISDGLSMDLHRLCAESGVGARVFEKSIPVSDEARSAALFLRADPMKLALSGGEDYEMLFAVPGGKRVKGVCIGEVTSSGISIIKGDGREIPLGPEGYEHFG